MNAQSIWAGEYYAFADFKGNKKFILNAQKGKAIKVEKRVTTWAGERKSAFALFLIEPENAQPYEKWVRARDVIDFWEDYERERRVYYAEQARKADEARIERERRNAEYEARIAEQRRLRESQEQAERDRTERLVNTLIAKTGLPKELITSVGSQVVSIDRTQLEFWLSIRNGDSNHESV
jgi:hypothetical protein